MNIAADNRLRLIALVAVLVFAIAGLGLTVLPRLQGSSNTAVPATLLPHATHKATAPTTKTHVTTHVTTHSTTSTHAEHVTVHKHVTVHVTKPVPHAVHKTPKLLASLPVQLAHALRDHRVVVVALGVAGSAVDAQARGEAKVGATLSGSGFVVVNATNERQIKAFRTLLQGDFDAPAVFIIKRPGTTFVRIDGFADRQLVAQAAANASA
ncbi:MAG TPA: hypothetical protein VH108_08650 [Gaiellaceae bacterium]|jgi:hypothetical protein|nr:hypothetical protein [Gaiellaceae bacterium]